MAYYINSGKRRKKNIFLGILIAITLMGSLATVGLSGGFFYVDKKVKHYLVTTEVLKQEQVKLEQQLEQSKEQITQYKEQLDTLNEQLIRFEPVIIPESMLGENQ